ncbi:hypothetical protein DMB66_21385 [Actinoplanes sp. ATCC 53533]|uniref:hypothetical protein n=1 Tax=Actinoplanes sp. ATCC 53533 TaxID=1288362 RepID=UPI000F765F56|nr:hypothetical protein [Actinoplanes sp. ATCC 53533]RSM64062.1 hypothetical protein DMB66_21385 [Actinoplanes sp. ATCC 53533]
MSRSTPHTPQPDGDPALPGADPTLLVDLVAGDPPVPITVWRTARTGDAPTTTVPTRLAYRLVAAYSRPGEAVVDLTDGHALTAACQRGGRSHHPAWFTDAASLIIGPATSPPGTDPDDEIDTDLDDPDGPEPPDLAAWFGDDLTDPALPPAGPPVAALAPDASVAGVTSLVVACWPLDASGDAANRVRLAWLLTACKRLLRPGGCLVIVVGTPVGRPATPEDFRPLVAAASAAGLGYLQHIVAVAADTDGDQFTYFATDEELLALAAGEDGQRWAVAHVRVHADCFVFSQTTKPTTKPAPRRRRGGDADA